MRTVRGNLIFAAALCAAAFLPVSVAAASSAKSSAKAKRAAQGERLGSVSFPISCTPEAQSAFNTGVALLHSFQYEEAEQTFSQVAQQDPTCAMAYWGKAMSLYHQLWDWPSDDTLKEGHGDTMQAQKLRAKTDRERMYIVAAGVFFQDNPKLSKASRIKAYSDWMGRIFTKYPDDVNAGAFYALSLITLQGKKTDEDANRKQAIAILDQLFQTAPDNPGVAHYLIHSADTPELAPQGLDAARRYAKIAPDSSHALHMPSHIFVRLGLWQEAIDSNLAAADAAAKATQAGKADATYQFHALDFLNYAYLQSGQAGKAQAMVAELTKVQGATADEITENMGLLTARNVLELHQWSQAVAQPLPDPDSKTDWKDTVYWTRTIGAARIGGLEKAKEDLQKFDDTTSPGRPWPEIDLSDLRTVNLHPMPLKVPNIEAHAWVEFASGKQALALALMRVAAKQEESEGVDSLAMPAREMLGDMLLEMKKPAEALEAYKAALAESPNRFDSLYGAAQAAQLSGDAQTARKYYSKLVEICGAGADRQDRRKRAKK